MARRIKIAFPDRGIEAIASLEDEQAPLTCDHVWKSLEQPLEGIFNHGHESGPEIWFYMPPAPDLPNENATLFPEVGDILFYHYDGQLPRGEKIFDMGIYYGRGGKGLLAVGWVPGNLFATVTENLKGVQEAARFINDHGPQRATISRVGD